MSRKIYDEDLRLNLILNGEGLNKGSKKMVAELGAMEQGLVKTEQQARELAARIKELEKDEVANAAQLRTLRKYYDDTTRSIKAQILAIEDMRKKVGLAGMTVQQLRNHLNALKAQLYNMAGSQGTPMFNKLQAEIRETEIRLRTLTTGASRFAQAWERLERTANRAGTIVGYSAMVAYGITRLVTNVITRMKDLEDVMGTVRKNTSLTAGQVWDMKDAFDQWDTRTKTDDLLQLAIVAGKLGIAGKEEIMKFVDSANMIQIALGDDLEGTVEDTVNSIGKLTNAFRTFDEVDKETGEKLTIDKAMLKTGSILNELAKSSAASAGTILNYMTRLSSVGELAGFTQAQIGGIASAMDAMNIPSERGATAIQKIMMALANPKKINDFAGALGLTNDEFGSMDEKYKQLLKDDPNYVMMNLLNKFVATKDGLVELTGGLKDFGAKGQYMTAVIGSMAQNLDVIAVQQDIATKAWEKGTSILDEYNIMNNNFTADILKQQKIIRAQTDHMNKDAEPAVLRLVTAWASFVVGIRSATDWIGRNWSMIKTLTFAYIALKAPAIWRVSNLILEDLWLRKAYASEALKVFWMKASILWTRNLTAAQTLAITQSNFLRIANIALTQGLRAAWVEMQALRAASVAMAFPFTAAAAAVAVLGGALYWLVIRKDALTEAEKRHNALQKEIQDDFFTEKANLTVMLDRLKDTNITQTERLKLIKKINEEYGEYLPKLLSEGSTAKDLATSYDLVVEALARKITYEKTIKSGVDNQIAQDKIKAEIKMEQERLEAFKKTNAAQMAMRGAQGNVGELYAIQQMEAKITNLKSQAAELSKEYTELQSQSANVAPKQKQIEVKGVLVDMPSEDTFKASQDAIKRDYEAKDLIIKQHALTTKQKQEDEEKALRLNKINFLTLQIADMQKFYRTEGEFEEAYQAAQVALIAEKRAIQLDDKKEDQKDSKSRIKDVKEFGQELVDVEKLRIEAITNERERAIAEEEERTRQVMEKNWKNDEALEYEEQIHARNITEINLKFLDKQLADKSVNFAQKKALLDEYLRNELISEEAYWTIKAKITKDEELAFWEFKKQYGLLNMEQTIDLEIAELKRGAYWARLTEEEKEKAIDEIRLKYGRARAKKLKKTLEDELNDIKEGFSEQQQISFEKGNELIPLFQRIGQGMGDAFASMFDLEQNAFAAFSKGILLLAIDETKKYVELQYVKMMARNIAHMGPAGIAVTLGEIVLIEAAFAAAKGLASQINTAKKTKQKAEGSYPVIGADDGILYHAAMGGRPITGVYSQPTLLNMSDGRSLVGERAPELVVDGDTFRRIQLNAPGLLRDIYAYAGRGGKAEGVKQKAEGQYPNPKAGSGLPISASNDGEYERMRVAIERLNAHLDKGITTIINKYGTNGLDDAINQITTFKSKTGRK